MTTIIANLEISNNNEAASWGRTGNEGESADWRRINKTTLGE